MEELNFNEMSAEEIEKHLKPKERRFVWEYEKDWNGTRAAIRAGYSEKSAAVIASRLLKKVNVAAYARARQRDQYEALNINKETLSIKLNRVLEQCMEGTEHLSWNPVTREYEPDGTFVFDSKGANGALKLLGDSIGMYQQQVKVSRELGVEAFLKNQPENEADEF
ncbi:MAG: terminase small subunit [Oscillospiraceae bacterium]|nr:terminase small subunit [Oscillospiraceae bacterium]